MRILLVSGGVGGDVFPFARIANFLEGAGHHARVACSPIAAASLRRMGLPTLSIGRPFERAALANRRSLTSEKDSGDLSWLTAIRRFFLPWNGTALDSLRDLAGTADLVATHPMCAFAYEAAHLAGVPLVTLQLFPSLEPSAYRPGSKSGEEVVRLLSERWENQSLSLWEEWTRNKRVVMCEPELVASELRSHCVGFPIGPLGFGPAALPADVLAFSENNERRLVVLCQGTLLSKYRSQVTDAVLQASRNIGFKLVVVGLAGHSTSNVLFRDFLPLGPLLDRAHLVVHHAGAGTIREVIRSGLPSVAVPGPFDTCWNAGRFVRFDERMSIVRPDEPLQIQLERIAAELDHDRSRTSAIEANPQGTPPLESICRELSQLERP